MRTGNYFLGEKFNLTSRNHEEARRGGEMIRQSWLRRKLYNEKIGAKRRPHIKVRQRFKWLIETRADCLKKEFREIELSHKIGLSDIRRELTIIGSILHSGLSAICKNFTTFDTPLKHAADHIARCFENFDKRKDSLSKELREEYHGELKKLVGELRSYAKQLVETNYIQIERSTNLEKNIYDLSKLSVLLSDTLKILGAMVRKTDKKQKDKGEMQQVEESIFGFPEELLKEFTGQYKNSNENFERLFTSVTGSLSQVSDHIRDQSEINRALLRNIGKLSEGVSSMSESFKKWEKVVQIEESKTKKEKPVEQGAVQPDQRIDKKELLIDMLSKGFQGLKDQDERLVNQIKRMSDHLKILSKPKKAKKRSAIRKTVSDSRRMGEIIKHG